MESIGDTTESPGDKAVNRPPKSVALWFLRWRYGAGYLSYTDSPCGQATPFESEAV